VERAANSEEYSSDNADPIDGQNVAGDAPDPVFESRLIADNAGGVASEASSAGEVLGKIHDAVIRSPYNPADYSQPMTYSIGAHTRADVWSPKTKPISDVLSLFFKHQVGIKDGTGMVFGKVVEGPRVKTGVELIDGVVIDVDNGKPFENLVFALLEFGYCAILFTTHSHGKTETDITKDRITKFAGEDNSVELLKRFARDVLEWDQTMVDSIAGFREVKATGGLMIRIEHAPFPRTRIILPFKTPFDVMKGFATHKEGMETYPKIPLAVAGKLGVRPDKACLQVNHMFLLPRHAEGRPFEVSVFGGPLLDWNDLELGTNPFADAANDLDKGKRKSITEAGKKLGKWSKKRAPGFQIADVINDLAHEKIRGSTAHGFDIECPFDGEHSTAGDPNDRACMVVNAGEGPSELFAATCRHESCRKYTMLDMLGKMLEGAWFDKSVLEDDRYNAILDGEEESPFKPDAQTDDVIAEQKAREELFDAIKKMEKTDDFDVLKKLVDRIAKFGRGWTHKQTRTELFLRLMQKVKGNAANLYVKGLKKAADEEDADIAAEAAKKEREEKTAEKMEFVAAADVKIPLPSWGDEYGPHKGRVYVFKIYGDDVPPVPLHTPLRIRSGVMYVDRRVQGRNMRAGVSIEFIDGAGKVRTLSFQRSKAFTTEGKAEIISDLTDADMGFEQPAGPNALLCGILSGEKTAEADGMVFDYPGQRGPVFIDPWGNWTGATNHQISLSKLMPLPEFETDNKKGSFDGWLMATTAMFNREMLEKAPHAIATHMAGYASSLIDMTKEDSSVLWLGGYSTNVKTVAMRSMASIYGPTTPLEGVIVNFNSTPNMLEQFATRRSGCGMGIDETKLAEAKELGSIIYRISSNMEKARMTKESLPWHLLCVISSERGLEDCLREGKVKTSPGLWSRVVEFDVQDEEISNDTLNAIKGAYVNYGHAGMMFVKARDAEGWDCEKIIAEVDAKVGILAGNGVKQERRASRALAYIWLGGEIAQRAGLIPADFDIAAFIKDVWETVRGKADTKKSIVGRVISTLSKAVLGARIDVRSNEGDMQKTYESGECDGAILDLRFGKGKDAVFVVPSGTLARIGGEAAKVVAKILDDEGMLMKEPGRRIQWQAGRTGVGMVGAYVIYASTVLGEDVATIEDRIKKAGSGVAAPVAVV